MLINRFIHIGLCLILTAGVMQAQPIRTAEQQNFLDRHATMVGLNCSACHDCINPSFKEPCLKLGPHFFHDHGIKIEQTKMPPEEVKLNKIEKLYNPVTFKHRKHMHMAELIEDCAECHHYIPPDLPKRGCEDCHITSYVREKLETISLNGIYHRKCLGCHIEWSKSTNCELCHVSKDHQQAEELGKELPKYRKIERIQSKLFVTRYFYGPFVLFDHKFHTEEKKLHCPDCHNKQPCVGCHYQNGKPTNIDIMARDGVHGTCRYCHDVMTRASCEKCHKAEEPKVPVAD